ncbi:hypothetical protein EGW08_005498 [Elysia chlorotica]|uniref:Uncharacterized protein n=1 Tax=Elysia chlorotica TaxID=188477 RepID=A0A433TYY1_ELYCH|nr:hypothetical protein EGW08_005498 [Elysia chlorotica]
MAKFLGDARDGRRARSNMSLNRHTREAALADKMVAAKSLPLLGAVKKNDVEDLMSAKQTGGQHATPGLAAITGVVPKGGAHLAALNFEDMANNNPGGVSIPMQDLAGFGDSLGGFGGDIGGLGDKLGGLGDTLDDVGGGLGGLGDKLGGLGGNLGGLGGGLGDRLGGLGGGLGDKLGGLGDTLGGVGGDLGDKLGGLGDTLGGVGGGLGDKLGGLGGGGLPGGMNLPGGFSFGGGDEDEERGAGVGGAVGGLFNQRF